MMWNEESKTLTLCENTKVCTCVQSRSWIDVEATVSLCTIAFSVTTGPHIAVTHLKTCDIHSAGCESVRKTLVRKQGWIDSDINSPWGSNIQVIPLIYDLSFVLVSQTKRKQHSYNIIKALWKKDLVARATLCHDDHTEVFNCGHYVKKL